MSRVVDPNSAVFCAIRDGSILNKAKNFKKEELKPFLPVLMYRTFSSYATATCFSQESDRLDYLRACLIECREGNDILLFLRNNYEVLEQRFLETKKGKQQSNLNPGNYSMLSLNDKLFLIGSHILNKMTVDAPTIESFEPFDAESYQEEVIWIISFLCFYIPSFFNVAEFAPLLLRYSYGKQLIMGVIMNHPQRIEKTLIKLLFAKNTDEGICMRRKNDTIFGLLRIDPNQAEDFLGKVLEAGGRYRLAVTLLCSRLIHDKVFVNTLIYHLLQKNNQFSAFLIKHANKETAEKIRKRFNEILQLRKHPESKERSIILLCVLSTYNIIRVNSNEPNHIWIKVLTDTSVTNVRLLKIMLATILACPNLLSQNLYSDSSDFHEISEFFAYLRELTREGNASTFAPLNQFMLLIAIHLKADNQAELSKLLSSELSLSIGDVLRRQVQLKTLFLQKAMLEEDLAQKAANLGVTKGLDNNMSGYLPVHCINQLLVSRIFSKNQINIQDWIKKQLLESQLPVHHVMVQMLESFAASCFPSGDDYNYNTKIDELFFWDVFKTELFSNDNVLATRILSLFYLLAYTRRVDTTVIQSNKGRLVPTGYSDDLWAEIPIRYILSVMDARHKDFELIRPSLLHYVGSSIPHMLPTLDASLDKTEDELAQKSRPFQRSVDPKKFAEAVDNIKNDIVTFTRLLRVIESAPIHEQYNHYDSIIKAVAVTLDGELCPLVLARKLAKIWKRLENLIPRKLYEKTLDLWLNSSRSAGKGPIQVTNSLLLKETPLIMFRVDDRIFRSPPHFELLLRMLSFYLDSVKNTNLVRLTKAVTMSETRAEIDERHQLFKGFTGTQHLAVVQVLLEICDGDDKEEPTLNEIRDLACAQIHQMFVADPALPKLVHFNMYPVRLIPMVVDKVPSAHVLLAELHELVHQSHIQRRIFAVNLIAELARKYTIPMSLAGLEFMEDVLTTLINSKIDESVIILFSNIVPALKTFINLSPMHSESVKKPIIHRISVRNEF
ncbi:unnamed protein product [Bursaphelenchus xylophilus]|uniref:(pine wood nematode) hypothetical protein n=1 Tax=Bursaphelenchus xylophilus TaxID=6326 RepID=A0A1I7SMG1_BURXY|nr:unnamed protein product [Bursaphelenchus xylophilus]CAG9130180.1 unnamed protein product [Bursaphelenchus xylophilus]